MAEEKDNGKISALKALFGTLDSASLIAIVALTGGFCMMIVSLLTNPGMFVVVAAISIAIMSGFTGVHIGSKATEKNVPTTTEIGTLIETILPLVVNLVKEMRLEEQKMV